MFGFIDNINAGHLPGSGKKGTSLVSFLSPSESGVAPSYGDQETLNKIYENLEIVYRCVFMAASNIARLPKKIIRIDNKGNETDVSELFPIFTNPNDQQTDFDFWVESISRLSLQGELFWELLLDGSGYPSAMFADWRSEEIDVKNKDQVITGYRRNTGTASIDFTPDEVIFIKSFNPYSKFRGISPLRSARHSVELDLDALNFNKSFFKQGMKINGILQTEQELDSKVAKRIRKDFEKVYSGLDNMHKTAVLHSGLSFTALNDMSLTDAQFLELRTMNRENIALAYGTPLEVLGIGKATFQNEKYARRKYWTETLFPEIMRVEQAINKNLVPRLISTKNKFLKYKFKFITKDIEALKEDRSAKVKDYVQGLSQRALTINEMRVDVFGKEPFKDSQFDAPPEVAIPVSNQVQPKDAHICGDATLKKKAFY